MALIIELLVIVRAQGALASLFFFLRGVAIGCSSSSWNITDDRFLSEWVSIIKLSHIIDGVMLAKLKSLVSTTTHVVLT